MSTVVDKLTARLQRGRGKALAEYRRLIGLLATDKALRSADESALTEAMGVLGIGPSELEHDVEALRRHRALAKLADADDPDVLAAQAREARQSAEDHRIQARQAEQEALAADAKLRGVVARRGELKQLERANPRLFASDVEVALGSPPEAEDTERPTDRPEPPVHELVARQAAERLGWPPVAVGGRP